jgi:hypothetical protein
MPVLNGSYRMICSLIFVTVVLMIMGATFHMGLAGDILQLAPWSQNENPHAPATTTAQPSMPAEGTSGGDGKHLDHTGAKDVAGLPKIIGLVFYGRKEVVSILDCYLKVCVTPNMCICCFKSWSWRLTYLALTVF